MCSAEQDLRDSMEARLMDLIDRGYQFIHPRDDDGNVVAVVGIRAHGSVIDVVRLNAEDDVEASRLPGDEADILTPQRRLWSRRGGAGEVLDELLALADSYGEDLACRVSGCWVPGRGSSAKWLAAAG
ncbi:hypothetical protein [Amycolatopsis alkalitolerans]|uniref:Uncharacterized protein n=1 Tax=Amycolatopsis alkalitolerans TaxID=2547244 RepID=A0A5C4M489_9PSEU|nr:hypothetical protein [Amycolatopsis alkalitolerans]TNC26119.1 hypothetical protein FG385_13215 [Amycolatopsis alkalitolerans]